MNAGGIAPLAKSLGNNSKICLIARAKSFVLVQSVWAANAWFSKDDRELTRKDR